MIAKLKGIVDFIGEDYLILDVNGVGYRVFAASRTLANLPAVGAEMALYIETNVREDHIHLYGFASAGDLEIFRLLQSVQGVGAKVALGIQTVLSPDELQLAVAAQDKAMVARANGVGPKLAGRIVMELKDKVAAMAVAQASSGTPLPAHTSAAGKAVAAAGDGQMSTDFADAVSALVNLGYRPVDAHAAVAAAKKEQGDDASLDTLIRVGLKNLS